MDINRYLPSYGINHANLTTLKEYSTEEIFEILYAAKAMKEKFLAHEDTSILKGVTLALLFGDTSLRTRSALEIGIRQLGGVCVNLPYSEKDMNAGENIRDVVNILCTYGVGALVTRGISEKSLSEYCQVSRIPIINSYNDDGVPLQTLTDLYTVWEKEKKLEGVKIAYVGKATPTAASLLVGAVKCGMNLSVATPEKFAFTKEQIDDAMQFGTFEVTENPIDAVRDALVVYTDNYTYHTRVTAEEKKILYPYQVNKSLMSFAQRNAIFMHSLPANRGVEVTEDIIDGKNSAVLDQGENKLHVIKAVLALLIK